MKTGSPSSSSFKFLNLSHYNEAYNRRLRVADILISDEDEEEEKEIGSEGQVIMGDGRRRKEACRSFGVILSRWLSLLRRGRRKRRGEAVVVVVEREGRQKDGGELGSGSTPTRCSMNGLNGDSTAALTVEERKGDSEGSCDSGRYRKEASFNLGVGFGLIYLMAISRNELSEMIELRKQMEILLQNGKQELHRKDKCSKAPESSNYVAYSTTDVEESVNNNDCLSVQNSSESHILPYLESTMKPNQALNNDMPREEECVKGIDQLEAEFEAELERLQLRLDTDYLPIDHREERIEVAVEETAPGGSLSASFGEVIDPHEAYAEGDYGVPPDELKIRLHELLQEKQEERIKELEAALGRAKQKLREKEMEVSWWKDTAHLISKRKS